jgi:hypothetical protein
MERTTLSTMAIMMTFFAMTMATNMVSDRQQCKDTQVVDLGDAARFAVLGSSTVTNSGATVVTGDLGVYPGSAVTGFPPGHVNGAIQAANGAAGLGRAALLSAINDAAGRVDCPVAVAGNIGGQTLTPGLYKSTGSLDISSGDLTLSGAGVYIFQVASDFSMTDGRQVILSNGATADNIFWQVGTLAALGTTATMYGNILASNAVTLNTGAVVYGRCLAYTAEVTMLGNTVTKP